MLNFSPPWQTEQFVTLQMFFILLILEKSKPQSWLSKRSFPREKLFQSQPAKLVSGQVGGGLAPVLLF